MKSARAERICSLSDQEGRGLAMTWSEEEAGGCSDGSDGKKCVCCILQNNVLSS